MVKRLKIIRLLFFLLIFVTGNDKIYGGPFGRVQEFLTRNSQIVSLLGNCTCLVISCQPLIRQIWESNSEFGKQRIEEQRLLNEQKTLSNKKLEQSVELNNDPKVQESKIKSLAAQAALQKAQVVLQSNSKWIQQELQIRAQAIETQNKEQRVALLQEMDLIDEWKKNASGDEKKKKFDLTRANLLRRYNNVVNGLITVTIEANDKNREVD